jgi:hypothetical protein
MLVANPLAALAQELEIGIIAIMHFNEGTGNASDKVSRTQAFRDLARSVLLFATDDKTGERIVSMDKANYSEEQKSSVKFKLVWVEVATDDRDTTPAGQVVYLGHSPLFVSDIINRASEHDTDDRNETQAFILDHFRDCEASAADAIEAGRSAGFSENDIKHARGRSRNPRIASVKSTFGAGWMTATRPTPSHPKRWGRSMRSVSPAQCSTSAATMRWRPGHPHEHDDAGHEDAVVQPPISHG